MQGPFDILADLDTPVSAFRKLGAFEPTFLLESAESGEKLGRYSFIGLGRGLTVRLEGATLSIDGRASAAPTKVGELLDALRAAFALAPRLQPEAGVPLGGGVVGMIGYDFIRRLEKLPSHAAARAGEADVLMTAPKSMLVFDHLTRRAALLHAGPEWERASLRREIMQALRGPQPPAPARSGHEPPTPSIDEATFLRHVETVKEHIRAGEVYQLVLSIRYEGKCLTDPFEVYRALRLLNPSPYMYYLDLGETKIVGSSPEALVKLKREDDTLTAELRPIAGTRRRGADDEADAALAKELLADVKESAEHVMLVDLARNDLGRVARPGTVKVHPFRSIERYSHVMHIVSGVRGVLEPHVDALGLFAATFPAGTVVGAPKVRAMQIIDELEPIRRGFYAGTAGYFSLDGNMDQAIAIRTIAFRDGRYTYQAGAGIVIDSDPAAEFREVRAKVGVLESALAMASGGIVRMNATQGADAMPQVLMIDNYDSFTYNVVQALRGLGASVRVVRNDEIDVDAALASEATHVVISPGPGAPADAGVSIKLLRSAAEAGLPVLGVCLGHQAIGEAFGGAVIRAPRQMHGKTSMITHDGRGVFAGLPSPMEVGRYHSLMIREADLPAELEVSARTSEGEIMGVRHRTLACEGVQFHPESVLTPLGEKLIGNFLAMRGVTAIASEGRR